MSGLFIRFSDPVTGQDESSGSRNGAWTIEGAERLLGSLKGVVSARVVARSSGEIEEIHILMGEGATPKQTVRNVESALRAQYDVNVDHRKISVAQTEVSPREVAAFDAVQEPEPQSDPQTTEIPLKRQDRFLFIGHSTATERSHRVRIKVELQWRGERYEGSMAGADLPRARYDATALATLDAIEQALDPYLKEQGLALSLDGVKLVDAFDRQYMLVAVHAIHGRSITGLAGAATIEDTPDRAVVLATLQATDRWVRGHV